MSESRFMLSTAQQTERAHAVASSKIHVALTFDDNFWAPAYATMRSICIASHRRADLVFHLCHRPLTDEHVADLRKIESEYGATLTWYDLENDERFNQVIGKARYHKRTTNIVYARLMFDVLLPETVERIIYLDCDMYVRAPIEELYETDLEGHPIAAVRDPYSFHIIGDKDMRQNQDLFNLADLYFNAGLLVIDMDGWKKAGIPAKLDAAIADGTMDRIYYDQDFLNLVFANNWKRLPQMWNVLNPRGPHEAFDPMLLHYTGPRKPWHLVSGVAFSRVYRHVMTNELFYRYMRHRVKHRLRRMFRLNR